MNLCFSKIISLFICIVISSSVFGQIEGTYYCNNDALDHEKPKDILAGILIKTLTGRTCYVDKIVLNNGSAFLYIGERRITGSYYKSDNKIIINALDTKIKLKIVRNLEDEYDLIGIGDFEGKYINKN